MTSQGRNQARTLCFGEEANAIVRQLNFCYTSIKKLLKVSLELQTLYIKQRRISHYRQERFIFPLASISGTGPPPPPGVPKSSLSSQISVCAPAKRARPGPSLPLSVLLLSDHTFIGQPVQIVCIINICCYRRVQFVIQMNTVPLKEIFERTCRHEVRNVFSKVRSIE